MTGTTLECVLLLAMKAKTKNKNVSLPALPVTCFDGNPDAKKKTKIKNGGLSTLGGGLRSLGNLVSFWLHILAQS